MTALKLPVFAGMVPSIDEHLLSDQNATFAQNTWLYSGALEGMPQDVPLHTLADPAAAVVFRIPSNMEDPTNVFLSTWVEFQNPDTDFIRAPVSGDQFRRHYWASSTHPPMYNTYDRIIADDPAWLLGIPQPVTPSVVVSGGASATIVSRAYVTTLETAYGEEGPASTPVLTSGKLDATFTVTVGAVPAGDRGVDRNITKINLYRTIVSAAGTTTYYRVHQFTATGATQNYADTMTDTTLASKTILESTTWTGPPDDMEGIVAMPNGILAGWVRNELWFSEPYRPHAWPVGYSLSLEHDIVGLGVTGQTLVVCTKGNPMTASGVNPSAMTTSRLASFEPCISRGSILATEQGVFYVSPSGLVLVNAGVAQNITSKAISRDKWNEIALRAGVRAARLGTSYYAFGTGVAQAYQEDAFQDEAIQLLDVEGTLGGFVVDPFTENAGISYLLSDKSIKNVKNDPWSGEVFVIKEDKVYWIDQRPGYTKKPYIWRSKVFQLPKPQNFAAFRLFFKSPPDYVANASPNLDINQVFDPATQAVIVRVFADGKLVLAHEIGASGELHRVPSGFKAELWQVELEGIVRVNNFQMATSVKELSLV